MGNWATLASDPAAWAALLTLIAMELVLGIDNLVFVSILTNTLPEEMRVRARRIGLTGALVMRLLLLGTIAYIVQLTEPLFTVLGQGFSWRDLIMLAGGLFLVWKATREIHRNVEPEAEPDEAASAKRAVRQTMGAAVVQILLIDLVFSLDSIVTAVGMTDHVEIMMVAVTITVGLMMVAATPLANFIHGNPTIVMLALGFLLLIGTMLIAEGFGFHVPKGYIYAAMAFSGGVEGLNMLARSRRRRAAASDGTKPPTPPNRPAHARHAD